MLALLFGVLKVKILVPALLVLAVVLRTSSSSKDISELETDFYRRIRNKTTRSTFNTTVEAVIIISVTTITTTVRTYFI